MCWTLLYIHTIPVITLTCTVVLLVCSTGSKLTAAQSLLDAEDDDEAAVAGGGGGWGDDEDIDIDEGQYTLYVYVCMYVCMY